MKTALPTVRLYPVPCRSAYCGRIECPSDCPNLPELEDFKRWREATAAVVHDPIWCPTVYEATR